MGAQFLNFWCYVACSLWDWFAAFRFLPDWFAEGRFDTLDL
jgi:hypothetical protein